VMAYAGATIPAGWMLCDGAAVSRTGATADLFAAIGTAWGSGNGSTTFNLPDMRGLFLRGVDGSAGKDPDTSTRTASNPGGNTGNAVGSVQGDELESHSHTISGVGSQALAGLGLASLLSPGGASATNATGGQETRPKNAYVYYIIKL
jgi:microcystin-dependent protein